MNVFGFVAWGSGVRSTSRKLPRLEKKIRVALDWPLDLLFTKDFVQSLTVRGPVTSSHEGEPAATVV